MTKKYEIYVGTEFNKHGARFSPPIDLADSRAIDIFGGFSRHYVEGGYVNRAKKKVVEQSLVYALFAEDDKDYDAGLVRQFAKDCKEWFNQESVCLVSPDGSVEFI